MSFLIRRYSSIVMDLMPSISLISVITLVTNLALRKGLVDCFFVLFGKVTEAFLVVME